MRVILLAAIATLTLASSACAQQPESETQTQIQTVDISDIHLRSRKPIPVTAAEETKAMREALDACETRTLGGVSLIPLSCLKQELLWRDFDVLTTEEFEQQARPPLRQPETAPMTV